ncbi:MAG: DsbE family thiol:disulfide interchange protein [Pseudomonadota bacterium]
MKLLTVLPFAVFAALAGLFAGGMLRDDPDALPSTLVGQPAPAVEVAPLAGYTPFTTALLREPGPKLVNFWASWCAPCRIEHPQLMALEAEGLPIYGVNYKDDPEKADQFLRDLGDPFAGVGADDAGRMAIDWGVAAVPETFVIDAEGRVVLRFAGPITDVVMRTRITPAIEAASTE